MSSHFSKTMIGAAFLLASTTLGHAQSTQMQITVDESRILQLPVTPGAIILGNPSIADVSIQGLKLFVHGRSYGQTNLTILDLQGSEVASIKLVTVRAPDDTVAIYTMDKGDPLLQRFTSSCVDACQSILTVGDTKEYFETVKKQTEDKFKLATGEKSAEAEAPQAPQ
jgi:hypothetical protein